MITDTENLIEFLNGELNWPIDTDSLEYWTYEWTPQELGINPDFEFEVSIQQLKPVVSGQPWGLFFLQFEGLRSLPVTFIRKILRALVHKKRASADAAERMTWDVQDLMFINSLTLDGKQIQSFAHFSEREKGLHQLKTFSWDDKESEEYFERIKERNLSKLQWPDDVDDFEGWRNKWSSAFTTPHKYVITTSKQLSEELARFAANIKEVIPEIYELENDEGPMHHLFKSFREVLIKDLKVDGFADMVAQTITYGLFSASATGAKIKGIETLEDELPNTNPFLKQLFAEFSRLAGVEGNELDFDDLKVSRIVDMLNGTDMDAILADFGRQSGSGMEDPIIHFYETFLKAYDSQQKVQRGVFYTPKPVVSFIVRSVDEQLRTEFGLEDGLADTTTWGEIVKRNPEIKIPKGTSPDQAFVQILDPATGTGTFLVETIALIHKIMVEKWKSAGESDENIEKLWNDYVPKHLLTRIYGYELLMAPYAVAHLKIGLALSQTGYQFKEEQRLRIYLTNALESPAPLAKWVPDFLAHETKEVNKCKKNQHFTVVIGNPPYSVKSQNMHVKWLAKDILTNFVHKYNIQKEEKRTAPLQDDYVKFIRFSQLLLENSNTGILAFITNNGFTDNPLFRGMRQSLMKSFSNIDIINLFGDQLDKDDNVFEIGTGVSISFLKKGNKENCKVRYHHKLLGRTETEKLVCLNTNTSRELISDVNTLNPVRKWFMFTDVSFDEESVYNSYTSIVDIFGIARLGFMSGKDHFMISHSKEEMGSRIKDLVNPNFSDEYLRDKYRLDDSRDWLLNRARKITYDRDKIEEVFYRPFDKRYTYYDEKAFASPQTIVNKNFIGMENIGVCFPKNSALKEYTPILATNCPIEMKFCEYSRGVRVAPLYIADDRQLKIDNEMRYESSNIRPEFVKNFCRLLDVNWVDKDVESKSKSIGPRDVFNYIYSILYSSSYRKKYFEFLKIAFPCVPYIENLELFQKLSLLGNQLIELHIMNSSNLDKRITQEIKLDNLLIEKVSYSNETVWIDKEYTRGFKGVSKEVWNFKIGGYQVCNKWLKDRQAKGGKNPRPGHILTKDDIDHYQKIIVALSETIRIMKEIDEVIDKHGGWPDAFHTEPIDIAEDTGDPNQQTLF